MTAVQFCKTVTLAATNAAKIIRERKLRAFEERDDWSSLLGRWFGSDNPDYNQISIWEVYQPDLVIRAWMKEKWATEICSAVVSNSEEPSEGIRQLNRRQRPDQNMEALPKSRAWYLLEGDQLGHRSLKVAFKKVCHYECADLVRKLADKNTIRALLPYDAQNTLEERCAALVVRKVEAETLGCCAQTCGWNGAACGLWDFMNDEDQQDWKLECCAEGAILNGSFASQPFELS